MAEKEIKKIIRPKISYTALELADKCMFAYNLKYILKNFPDTSTLATELGTLIHSVNEKIGEALIKKEKPDYDELKIYMFEVNRPKMNKYDKDGVIGLNILKEKYFDEYNYPSEKTGLYYKDKLKKYFDNIDKIERMEKETNWRVFGTEVPFKFTFEIPYTITNEDETTEEVIYVYPFEGYIDRIDKNIITNELRVVDYKTKDSEFKDKELKTCLQMVIYGIACEKMYNKTPVEYLYDLPFLNLEQLANSKGYMKRGITKLTKLLTEIEDSLKTNKFIPTPTPLCHWCPHCPTNPDAKSPYREMCDYYCLWTRRNPIFEVNQKYTEDTNKMAVASKGFSLEDF